MSWDLGTPAALAHHRQEQALTLTEAHAAEWDRAVEYGGRPVFPPRIAVESQFVPASWFVDVPALYPDSQGEVERVADWAYSDRTFFSDETVARAFFDAACAALAVAPPVYLRHANGSREAFRGAVTLTGADALGCGRRLAVFTYPPLEGATECP